MSQAVDYFDRWAIALAQDNGITISAAWRRIEGLMSTPPRRTASPSAAATAATVRRGRWGREVAEYAA